MGIGSSAGIALLGRVQIAFRKRRIVVGRERHRLLALRKPHLVHRTVVSPYLPQSLRLCYRRFHNKPIMGLAAELAGEQYPPFRKDSLFSYLKVLVVDRTCVLFQKSLRSTKYRHSLLCATMELVEQTLGK